jgi:hypothetical protein
MAPLKHIYPIRNEEIISELSPADVRIGKLEIEVEYLKERVKYLTDLIIRQVEINKTTLEVLTDLNTRKL